jgi:hypothetical protein
MSGTITRKEYGDIVAQGCPEELVRMSRAVVAMEGLYFNAWVHHALEDGPPRTIVAARFLFGSVFKKSLP